MAYAKDRLSVDGVLAHSRGDFVPDENVERNGWAEQVQDTNPLLDDEPKADAPKAPAAPKQNAPVQ